MGKSYTCRRFPGLAIQQDVKFEDGEFTATNEAQEKLVESNDWFGSIICVKAGSEKPEPVASKAPEPKRPEFRIKEGVKNVNQSGQISNRNREVGPSGSVERAEADKGR